MSFIFLFCCSIEKNASQPNKRVKTFSKKWEFPHFSSRFRDSRSVGVPTF
ncbi:hypothetical protein LEP1GSC005_1829 [Leptospira santarosai str. ST188]|nr:hypothetical protein LEP1GSC005_1829 [Leptospira santarosai str. ST188]